MDAQARNLGEIPLNESSLEVSARSDALQLQPVLQLEGVTKVFKNDLLKKNQVALSDVHMSFYKGKCNALIGHNGAGKTTTIRVILGLISPDSGRVLFEGSPMKLGDKARIGYMPETNRLPQALTPEELLRFQAKRFRINGDGKSCLEVIEGQLKSVGLWAHRGKRIAKLSKGMGRRLAWAQATIHRPAVLILDEPFSGLDPLGRRDMRNWIESYKATNASIIFCVHDLAVVGALSDHVTIINRGKVVYTSDLSSEGGTDEGFGHIVEVSGIDEQMLRSQQQSSGLPAWSAIEREGYLTRLLFSSYEAACRWVQDLLQKKIVVVRFSDAAHYREAQLLKFFEKEDVL